MSTEKVKLSFFCASHDETPTLELTVSKDLSLKKLCSRLFKKLKRSCKTFEARHKDQRFKCVAIGRYLTDTADSSVPGVVLLLERQLEEQCAAKIADALKLQSSSDSSVGSVATVQCVYWMVSHMSDEFLQSLSAGGSVSPVPGKGYVDVSTVAAVRRDFAAKLTISVNPQCVYRKRSRLKDSLAFGGVNASNLFGQCAAHCPHSAVEDICAHPKVAFSLTVESGHPFRNLSALIEDGFAKHYTYGCKHEHFKLEALIGGFPLNGGNDLVVGSVEWKHYKDCLLSELFLSEGAGFGSVVATLNVCLYLDAENKAPKKSESDECYSVVDFGSNAEWSKAVCPSIGAVLDLLDLRESAAIRKKSTLASVYSADNCEQMQRSTHPHVAVFGRDDAAHMSAFYHGPAALCPLITASLDELWPADCRLWQRLSGYSLTSASIQALKGVAEDCSHADTCHLNMYLHPPRWCAYMFAMHESDCLVSGSMWTLAAAKHPSTVRLPAAESMRKLDDAVFGELRANGFGIADATLKRALDQRLSHLMACERHVRIGSPLQRGEMLALVLWTEASDALLDLRKCQCAANYAKWPVLDYCLISAIDKLKRLEKGRFEIYTNLKAASASALRGSTYLRSFVSGTARSVARYFAEGKAVGGLKLRKSERLLACDLSWISRFPKEHEFLLCRGIVHCHFDKWLLKKM